MRSTLNLAVALALCAVSALSGCDPMVRAETQARDYCAKQGPGLKPYIMDRERTETLMGPYATLKLHCIDPRDIVRTNDAFGVDLYTDPNIKGALILKVAAGAIAAKAGLIGDDVVFEYAGRPIGSVDDLQTSVAATTPGQQVLIKLRRAKKETTVTAQF